jgi:hypothetical protein
MAKVIKKGEDPGFFPKGGRTKMFGKGHASTKKPDISGKADQGSDTGLSLGGEGIKGAKGGSGSMFGKGHAGQRVAGITGKASQTG